MLIHAGPRSPILNKIMTNFFRRCGWRFAAISDLRECHYAKSETPALEGSSGQTPRPRRSARAADNTLSELPGATSPASCVPEVRLL